jgi:YD repeat-containing protein
LFLTINGQGQGNPHDDQERGKPDHAGSGQAKDEEKGKGKGKGKGHDPERGQGHKDRKKGRPDGSQKDKPWKDFRWDVINEELELASEQPDYFMDPVRTVECAYDTVGNRIQMAADGKETLYAYDAADRMISAGDESFIYDANGNLIERTNPSLTVKYTYTGDNKLNGVYYPDGTKVEYQYDAFRSKVARTQSYYDEGKIAQPAKSQGNAKGLGRQKFRLLI